MIKVERADGCKNCRTVIFTDEEDFWKWDEGTERFRMVDYTGEFYPLDSHPGTTQALLVQHIGEKLRLVSEADIIWRTVRLILEGLSNSSLNTSGWNTMQ